MGPQLTVCLPDPAEDLAIYLIQIWRPIAHRVFKWLDYLGMECLN